MIPDKLNETEIRRFIPTLDMPVCIDVLDCIDSTNSYLKRRPSSERIQICCAETQTQGRGRFGRTWYSPSGENIYFSARFRLEGDAALLSGLSLVSSLAVIHTLKTFLPNAPLFIKWPNDIIWQDKKLSGSLIELIIGHHYTDVIIGIGINVNADTKSHAFNEKPWCSLYDISGIIHHRNAIIGHLIEHLYHHFIQLTTSGLEPFLKSWETVDYLSGRETTVLSQGHTITGEVMGIDKSGRLVLKETESQIHYLSSGETSLTLQNKP